MDQLTDFVILGLATWRLSSLLTNEEGPRDIFLRLRILSGVEYDAYSNPVGTNFLSRLLVCVWCNSVWVGVVLTIVYLLNGEVAVVLALPFALSAAAIGFDEWLTNKRDEGIIRVN